MIASQPTPDNNPRRTINTALPHTFSRHSPLSLRSCSDLLARESRLDCVIALFPPRLLSRTKIRHERNHPALGSELVECELMIHQPSSIQPQKLTILTRISQVLWAQNGASSAQLRKD